MTPMLLCQQQVIVPLPAGVGGTNVYSKVFSIVSPKTRTPFAVPADLANKNDCLLIGTVWAAGNINYKTSQVHFYLTWNNFAANSGYLFGSNHITANKKFNIAKKLNFGAINNNQMRYDDYCTGSAKATRGWNTNSEYAAGIGRCDLKIYYN